MASDVYPPPAGATGATGAAGAAGATGAAGVDGAASIWGSKRDGNLAFDGTNPVTINGVIHTPAAGVYTLSESIQADTITGSGGAVVKPAGSIIQCYTLAGTLTVNDDGNDGSGTNPGGALSAGGILQRAAGAGATGKAADGAGNGATTVSPSFGGAGGAGGISGAGNGGGAGGSANRPASDDPILLPAHFILFRTPAANVLKGGSGGGGGGRGAGGAGVSGGGGGGGGVILIAAKSITGTITCQARGGVGGAGTPTTGTLVGGGGGGGGGYIEVAYASKSGTVTTTVTKGTGGAGGGVSGGAGVDGSNGNANVYQLG